MGKCNFLWRAIFAGIFVLLFLAPALAADPAAQSFVEAIYKGYGGTNSPGVRLGSKAALERYFTPALAALIDRDAQQAKAKGEVPALDGDPFIDAQDWEIKNLAIAIEDKGAQNAVATVSFSNYGETRQVKLMLVKLASGWRIDDIHWREGSLRGLYKK